jgi:hypothetical protein
VSLVFLFIVFVCVLRSLTIPWKICSYLFGVWILRSALLRSTTLNHVDCWDHASSPKVLQEETASAEAVRM